MSSGRAVFAADNLDIHKFGDSPVELKKIDFKFYKGASERSGRSTDEENLGFTKEHRTKQDALDKETEKLYEAKTLKQLVHMANIASDHMLDVGLFTGQIIPIIDVHEDTPDAYQITFVLREPSRFKATVNYGIDNYGESSGAFNLNSENSFGRGEQTSGQLAAGWRNTKLYNFSGSKPVLGWQRYTSLMGTVYRHSHHLPWSGIGHVTNGLESGIWHKRPNGVEHKIKWQADWRQVIAERVANSLIREHSGHSLKSSILHQIQRDTRDHKLFPRKGILLKLSNELAGLGGDVRFMKNQLEFSASTQLPADLILSCGMQAGYVRRRGGRTLNLLDRLYLGGPTDLRGFPMACAGPVLSGLALGGNASWATAIHLYKPLFPAHLVYAHVFACAGNVHPVEQSQGGTATNVSQTVHRMMADPRISVGCGLAVNLVNIARLELNYCVPLRARATDGAKPAIQFGAGVAFL